MIGLYAQSCFVMEPYIHTLPHLSLSDLYTPERLITIYEDMSNDYYWSADYSPEFYIAQARAGFVAVSEVHHGVELLLPELQKSYAVLDFDDLHISRHVDKMISSGKYHLVITKSLSEAHDKISKHHKHSWLSDRYLHTLNSVNSLKSSVEIVSALLYHGDELVAGEIGYIVGATYTSLSGFSSREPEHRNSGTLQMVLLGESLHRDGFDFWNLGQPYMPYKFAIGAQRYTRADFLDRWLESINHL